MLKEQSLALCCRTVKETVFTIGKAYYSDLSTLGTRKFLLCSLGSGPGSVLAWGGLRDICTEEMVGIA